MNILSKLRNKDINEIIFSPADVLRTIVSSIISCGILLLLFRTLKTQQIFASIKAVDRRFVLLALGISLVVNIFWSTLKYQRILRSLGCILRFREVAVIRIGCLPLKIIFPLKSSELFKALYLKRRAGLTFARATGSLLIDRGMNLLATCLLFAAGLLSIGNASLLWIPLVIGGVIVLFLTYGRMIGFLAAVARSIHRKLYDIVEQLLSGFRDIGTREKIILLAYSFIFQLSEFLNTYLLFRALGIAVPVALILLYVPLIIITDNLPVTVLGFGTREALIVFLFSRYAPAPTLFGAGLLVSFIEHVVPVVVGLFFLRRFLERIIFIPLKESEKEAFV